MWLEIFFSKSHREQGRLWSTKGLAYSEPPKPSSYLVLKSKSCQLVGSNPKTYKVQNQFTDWSKSSYSNCSIQSLQFAALLCVAPYFSMLDDVAYFSFLYFALFWNLFAPLVPLPLVLTILQQFHNSASCKRHKICRPFLFPPSSCDTSTMIFVKKSHNTFWSKHSFSLKSYQIISSLHAVIKWQPLFFEMFLRIWSLHATWSSCLPFSKCVWIKIFHWESKEYQEISPGITAVDQYIVNQVHSTFLKMGWHCIFHNNVCIVQYSLDFSTILCCNTVLQYFGVSWEKLSKVLKTAAGGSSRVLRCRYNFRVFAPLQPRLVHYQPNQPSSMIIYSNF